MTAPRPGRLDPTPSRRCSQPPIRYVQVDGESVGNRRRVWLEALADHPPHDLSQEALHHLQNKWHRHEQFTYGELVALYRMYKHAVPPWRQKRDAFEARQRAKARRSRR